jgi:CheY-like chemotaxis protein
MAAAVILLVEDNEDDVLLLKYALNEAGVRNPMHVVDTGEEAIAYLSGQGKYADRRAYPMPRVIFLDLKLPRKSGHDVLEWMGQQGSLREVVRVVLTGSDDPSDLRKSYELGANSYLTKPLTVEQLTHPGRNLRSLLLGHRLPREVTDQQTSVG